MAGDDNEKDYFCDSMYRLDFPYDWVCGRNRFSQE